MAELQGGGPHDGAQITVPKECVAVVTVSDINGQYTAALAVRDGQEINTWKLEEVLYGLILSQHRKAGPNHGH